MAKFIFEEEKAKLVANLNYLKSLGVEEYTLRKKWDELQNKIYADRLLVHAAQFGIWGPTDFENEERTVAQLEALWPRIVLANDGDNKTWWDIFRLFASTAEYNQPPTRHIRFLVVDENRRVSFSPKPEWACGLTTVPPGRVLGVGAISGDLHTISCRDEFIGWSKEQRDKMLRHSAVGSTIVPTQPFGANFLGGKLIAALTTSALLRNQWQMQYGDILAGLTTTSLYGRPSMYDGLKWWKAVGDAKGSIPIQPDDAIYARWRAYVKKSRPKEFKEATTQKEGVSGPVTGETMRVFSLICRVAGISPNEFQHGHERGVYYSCIYENTKEFLRGEITESDLLIKPLFREDTKAILDWWRPKAIARYKTLKAEGKLKPEKLFYNHGYLKDYETFKAQHLKHVGR
jgi:hypothetical protein